jgi:hypothetical protein
MATKKGAKKSGSKKAGAKSKLPPKSPIHTLYGRPILDAVRRGDPAEMRRLKTVATKHIADVTAALKKLDAKLNRS